MKDNTLGAHSARRGGEDEEYEAYDLSTRGVSGSRRRDCSPLEAFAERGISNVAAVASF
jgi:hypothetical protein